MKPDFSLKIYREHCLFPEFESPKKIRNTNAPFISGRRKYLIGLYNTAKVLVTHDIFTQNIVIKNKTKYSENLTILRHRGQWLTNVSS